MSVREVVVLGTASQAPTRDRNHNGYLLRWDAEGVLFDPGEGTQRQLTLAGESVSDITRICLTHFHGDHCLGLPGVVQRLSLDRVPQPVPVHFPAGGSEFFDRLRHASAFHEVATVVPCAVAGDGAVAITDAFTLSAARLAHPVETYGYRLTEPSGRRMLPERLAAHRIEGPDVGRLVREGSLRGVRLADVSVPRRGQVFAFVMDTAVCDAAVTLARDADLLVIEATFLHGQAALARDYGHLTAWDAGMVAAEAGVRRVVLSHFSQRYDDVRAFGAEAAQVFDGAVVVASDLLRVPMPRRRDP